MGTPSDLRLAGEERDGKASRQPARKGSRQSPELTPDAFDRPRVEPEGAAVAGGEDPHLDARAPALGGRGHGLRRTRLEEHRVGEDDGRVGREIVEPAPGGTAEPGRPAPGGLEP